MLYLKTNNIDKLIHVLPTHIEWKIVDKHPKNHYIAIGENDNNALISYTFDTISDIPFEHYYYFFKLLENLENIQGITEIFSYGSIGSKKFNQNSDIDIFLIADLSIQNIVTHIQKIMPDCYPVGESIKIWNNKMLLTECALIPSIAEAKKYIPESLYVPAGKRIFLTRNFDNCVNQLEQMSHIETDKAELIKANKMRLYHNVRILSKHKDDRWRFRFYCQIIEHCIVRLRAIIKGELRHNYLPRNAMDYLTYEEWQVLNYTVNDDPQKFIDSITPFAMKVIKEVEKIES